MLAGQGSTQAEKPDLEVLVCLALVRWRAAFLDISRWTDGLSEGRIIQPAGQVDACWRRL
jgi:hypothetical protein